MRVERQRRPAPTPATPPGPTAQRADHPSTRSVDGCLPTGQWRVTLLAWPRRAPSAAPDSPACRQKAYRARGGRASGTTGARRHRQTRQTPTKHPDPPPA